MTFQPIDPFATRAIDLIGKTNLITESGKKVEVIKLGVSFLVKIDERIEFASDNNLFTCVFLHSVKVGTNG